MAMLRNSAPSLEGYWFDHADASVAFERAGSRVKLARAVPPWIVVDRSFSTIAIGSRWPGQLWRVQVLELGDMSGLVAQPGYWRAAAIELLEALPLSALFGANGAAVLDILAQIGQLSRAQAEALDRNLDPDAWAAYSRAWMEWSQSGAESRSTQEEEWRGTLAASRASDKARSPIHSGFLLIHAQLRQRALNLDGDGAFRLVEEDGQTEQVLAPLWQNACDAFLFAAMALAAPQYVSTADGAVLTQAWHSVFPTQTSG